MDISEVGVPYKMFDELTTETALSLIQKDPTFQQLISQPSAIENCYLKVDKGFKALLSLKIPGLDVGIDKTGSAAEKTKQAKKLGKRRKKLHTMEMDSADTSR